MASRRLVETVARIVGRKLEDPRSRKAARKALYKLGGDSPQDGGRAPDAERDRKAGEELRDRVARALVVSEREDDLRASLREAIEGYNNEAKTRREQGR